MKKQILSLLLTGSMVCAPAAMAAQPDQTAGTWYDDAMSVWAQRGVLKGDGTGNLNPTGYITRAELAVILDRIMDYQIAASNSFADVADEAWYTDAVLKACSAGVLQGDGVHARPGDTITRQEAMVMMARVLELTGRSQGVNAFRDAGQVADWAKDSVGAMAHAGYVQGSGGNIMPTKPITRAEVAVMLDNMFAETFDKAGTYTQDVDSSAVISADDVTLQGLTIAGDLIVAEGVADGHVVLDGVTVEGKLIIRGGGTNSVVIKGDSKVDMVTVARQGGGVRVSVEGNAQVGELMVSGQDQQVKVDGAVESVTVIGADAKLEVTGTVGILTVMEEASDAAVTVAKTAVVSDLTVSGSDAALAVAGKVEQVSVTREADGVSIQTEKGSKIDSVVTSGSNTTVAGSGTVTKVEAAPNASGTTVSTSGTKVENNSGDSVTIPGGSVDAGQSGNTSGGSNNGGGSGGGSNNGGGSGGSDNGSGDGEDNGDGDGDIAGDQEQAKQALKELVKNAQAYDGYEDQPDGIWVYQGNFTTSESGDEMTVSGAYTMTQVADGTAMNDMARFLGALYRQDNGAAVQSISYNGETYTWDAERGLLGSNWVKDPSSEENSGNTLVSVLVADFAAKGAVGEITLNGNHEAAITLKLDLGVVVNSGAELTAALASQVESIQLGGSFEVERQISVNRPVAIDGKGHTITAAEGWTGSGNADKHLLNVGGVAEGVTIRNLTLDSANRAAGMQAYTSGAVVLEQVTLRGSNASGLNVNGSNVTANGLSISGSAWQDIDLSKGSAVEQGAVLTLTDANLEHFLAIVEDVKSEEDPATAQVTLDGTALSSVLHVQDGKHKQVFLLNAPLVGAVTEAGEYTYADGYTYAGSYESVFSGSTREDVAVTITARYDDLSALADGSAMNDMARFLGALYRQDNGATVASITYGGQVYTWANGENASNLGSNWVKDPESPAGQGNTLVSAIVSAFQEEPGETFPLELTLTDASGHTMTLTFQVTMDGQA
ncbi:hypothetical protein B5G34_06310 [Flavonifractor sp. An82]|uniref:S-layer homology domain-containing protein n=1 Tax=Flavonifractor sp. An82 TaxID=1965660 RepID=UPI000B3B06E8|nr:S-layer homology domain-containing protein [Flavonifractor sp. An82]OUN22484.1 hypothetical protein B5G34_06310 [Flavonifractor sp. An82]